MEDEATIADNGLLARPTVGAAMLAAVVAVGQRRAARFGAFVIRRYLSSAGHLKDMAMTGDALEDAMDCARADELAPLSSTRECRGSSLRAARVPRPRGEGHLAAHYDGNHRVASRGAYASVSGTA